MHMSQENINLLINRCSGDRQNLNNELKKIESYIVNKKKIDVNEILKLTNLAENFNTSELVDNCLSKNHKKTVNILNENNYSSDDAILIIKTLLNRSKRLLELKRKNELNKNLEVCISSQKPPFSAQNPQFLPKYPKFPAKNLNIPSKIHHFCPEILNFRPKPIFL